MTPDPVASLAPVLHDRLPLASWLDPLSARLPGTRPVVADDWVRTDEAHAGQMALRDRLIATRRDAVIACRPVARAAAAELLDATLDLLRSRADHVLRTASVRRPDGCEVPVDRDDPMGTLGRLVQEDLCLLIRAGDEHVLEAASLCFPAGWTLAEKLGRPLTGIHRPVAPYDPEVARRVQRLFDAIRPGRPLGRANAHLYDDPSLHLVRSEAERKPYAIGDGAFLRSEWQVLFRLPVTQAMVFSIHTYVLPTARLSPDQRATLHRLRPG